MGNNPLDIQVGSRVKVVVKDSRNEDRPFRTSVRTMNWADMPPLNTGEKPMVLSNEQPSIR